MVGRVCMYACYVWDGYTTALAYTHTHAGLYVELETTTAPGQPTLQMLIVLAWLAENVPTLVQHNPAIHGDSAQTKGTVLLSIVSSS